MTVGQFRKLALSVPGAVEGAHMGHPDFRVNGKVFASLSNPAKLLAMVKLTPDQQKEFLHTDPDTFYPATGAWGRAGCTMLRLNVADIETVGAAVTAAGKAINQKTG